MAKITLNDIINTYNLTLINSNFTKIEDEFQNKVLYRNNPVGEPNQMLTSLDMNGKRVLNLPAPVSPSEPLRYQDMVSLPSLASSTGSSQIGFIQDGTGAVARTVQVELRERVSVTQFGTIGDGVTSDQTALVNAVAKAFALGAELEWPAGTYLSTANIPNFHNVKHIGQGVVKRGSDTFIISGRTGSNKFYVSPTGSLTNDGLTSSQPMLTKQQAVNAWAPFAYALRNSFTINLAAGTYTEGVIVDGIRSPSELIFLGASKATTIIDGTTAVNVMGFNFNNINNARVRNITVRNWGGVGSGIIFQNGTRGIIDTCDGTNNAEANFNCSEDGEMVIVGACTSTGSKQGMRYYRNSGGSIGDGVNTITVTGATQSGIVVRDGSKVVANDNLNVNSCNSTSTTAGVLVQKDGYLELRTCNITGNSIGVYAEHNSIIDTQSGTRTVTGNTQDYRIRNGSFDRALFSFSADIAYQMTPRSAPSGLAANSGYDIVVDSAAATGLQFLTNGQNINIDFDKQSRISHVSSDNSLRFNIAASDTYRMNSAALLPVTTNAKTLGTSGNRWSNVFATNMTISPPASVTPVTNGDVTFQFTSNTQLTIKAKGTDGVVRSVNLTLA